MSFLKNQHIKKVCGLFIAFIILLTFTSCGGSYPSVKAKKEIDYKQETIKPFLVSGLNFYSWDNPNDADSADLLYYIMYKIQQNSDIAKYKDEVTGGYIIPEDIFEKEAKKYFDIDIIRLHYDCNWYNEDEKAYYCDDVFRYKDKTDNIKINEIIKNKENTVLDFDLNCGENFIKSYKLKIDERKKDIKLLSCDYINRDYFAICVGMNITFVDNEFENPTQLTSQQLFNYAMFVLDDEHIEKENWGKWWSETEKISKIPLNVIENILNMRLGEHNFNPKDIDCYDKEQKVFKYYIGGYGGARCPHLKEKTFEDSILTLTIDYGIPDVYETVCTKMKINDDYSYKLLSIKKERYS